MMANNVPITKYIDPLVDFAFKKIFGTEPNKDLLIAFLNEVMRGHRHITDVVYNQNEHPGDIASEGGVIFDLLCTGVQGEQFLIEIQRGRQENFKQRALFYMSRLISNQAPKGRRHEWKYNLKEVYLIALLDGFVLEDSAADSFIQDIFLCNKQNGKIFYEKLSYTYIELLKFDKNEDELETDLDRWLYVLKNMSKMNKIPVYLRKPIFEKLFNIAEYSKFTTEEKKMYNNRMKYKWDNKNVLDYAVKIGREETTLEVKKEIAGKMKKTGMPIAEIAKFTDLPIEEISAL